MSEVGFRQVAFGPARCTFDCLLAGDGSVVELLTFGEFTVRCHKLCGLVPVLCEPLVEVAGGNVVRGTGEVVAVELLVADLLGVGDLVVEPAAFAERQQPGLIP